MMAVGSPESSRSGCYAQSQFRAKYWLCEDLRCRRRSFPFDSPCCYYSDKFHNNAHNGNWNDSRQRCQTVESVMHAGSFDSITSCCFCWSGWINAAIAASDGISQRPRQGNMGTFFFFVATWREGVKESEAVQRSRWEAGKKNVEEETTRCWWIEPEKGRFILMRSRSPVRFPMCFCVCVCWGWECVCVCDESASGQFDGCRNS